MPYLECKKRMPLSDSELSRMKPNQKAALGLFLAILALILGGVIYTDAKQKALPAVTVEPDFRRSLGNAQARVTIIEYGDFGCPTCKNWQRLKIMEQVLQQYGDQVRFVWRDFPVITAECLELPKRPFAPTTRISSGRITTCCSKKRRLWVLRI